MQPFNDTRQKGIDILKAYCKKAMEVPEPQEYYAVTSSFRSLALFSISFLFHFYFILLLLSLTDGCKLANPERG